MSKRIHIVDLALMDNGGTGNPYPTSPHERMSVKVVEEKDGRIAELEAKNAELAGAFDRLYFFAEQALSGIDFGNRRVLAFTPLVVLQQAIEQHRELAERLEEATMNDGAIGG